MEILIDSSLITSVFKHFRKTVKQSNLFRNDFSDNLNNVKPGCNVNSSCAAGYAYLVVGTEWLHADRQP